MVAASRAMASRAKHPLIKDPFALPLVRAVGVDLLSRLAGGELTADDLDGDAGMGMQRMTDNMAIRTMFFDEFFLDATAAGIRQAVILASGLDSRAYRLPWPAGTTVYEIDQPDVIEFKTRTLADLGAEPTAQRRAVAIDLRHDWPTALTAARFDPSRPTAWSAEGLLGYLPPEAQDRLLDTITALSAPGSRFATESAPMSGPADEERMRERMQGVAERGATMASTSTSRNWSTSVTATKRRGYLAEHGWQISGASVRELFAAHGLPPIDDDEMGGFADLRYISGTLTGTGKNGEHR